MNLFSRQRMRKSRAVSRLVVAMAACILYAVAANADEAPPGVIRFRGHMALGASSGVFRQWRITRATIDEEHPERSEIEAVVDLDSLDTENSTRDRHLRGADFFDVERYPTARIRVSGVRVEDPQHFTAAVELELHGQVQNFPMRFMITDRAARRIISEVTLKRSDFRIGPPMGWSNPLRVADDVQVMLEATVPAPQTSTNSAAYRSDEGGGRN
jgi:polyisoprenoid-binding protein YceI